MKLLIITQKVNKIDPILGFFHRWIEEFAKHCSHLTVICLEKGEYQLPANVKVLSLGKENGVSRIKYLYKFFKYIRKERKNYDFVFVHMNPVYVILGGIYWRIKKKKISLWYTHKQVDIKLRIAEKISSIVFSASDQSFLLPSKKLRVLGHGIDTDLFSFGSEEMRTGIVTSGRISSTKNISKMIDLVGKIKFDDVSFSIIGEAQTEEEGIYKAKLEKLVRERGGKNIIFTGKKTQEELAEILKNTHLFLNMSKTESLDKAVLEAMACGCIPLVSNPAFSLILNRWGLYQVEESGFAEKMERLLSDKQSVSRKELRDYVVVNHSIDNLIHSLVESLRMSN